MPDSLKIRSRHAFEVVLAFTPWVIATFILYSLEYGEIWTTDTPHRGKISVAILVTGMLSSFLIHSRFTRRRQK